MGLQLRSTAFESEDRIPAKHTCDGADVSPPLAWVGTPDDTESITLILEDIDSVEGVWSHWVVYDLPPDLHRLREAVSPAETLSQGGAQGRNDFDNIGYGGPCPSDGKAHRYVVRIYALDTKLDLEPGARREEVLDALEGHVIEQAELTGHYGRLADR
jgi:hypothetical protein